MKKVAFVFALASAFSFASCDSPAEERAEEMEERAEDMEDRAEERADDMEDMDGMDHMNTDTTAVIE